MAFIELGGNSRSGITLHTLAIPAVLVAVLALSAPYFLSLQNLGNLSSQIAALVIVALGQLLVALVAGIDLSVGSVISLTNCIIATGGPLSHTLPIALAIGVGIGLVNGWGVAVMDIHPIIMTLSSMTFLQGATYAWQPTPGGQVSATLIGIADGHSFGVPNSLLWSALCALAVGALLHRSRYGLHLFAAGGNPHSARLNGVAVRRVVILAYVLCSVLAVISGLYLSARIASGDPNVGASFSLDSVTAIALGGTQLSGGVGGVISAIAGALSLGLISNGMNLIGVSPFMQSAIKGLLLLIAICAHRRKTIGL